MKYFILFLMLSFTFSCKDDNSSQHNIVSENSYTLESKSIDILQNIEGQNYLRNVIIQTPNNIEEERAYPIVFAFHGRGGNNVSWINKLNFFTITGEFIGVYPQGFLESWNLGAEPSKADDIEFVNLIIDELQNYDNLDFERIYAIGTSNGAGMVNKLALETNHFKAISPVVSQLIESLQFSETTQPTSVFQINGAADTTVPIEGGLRMGHNFLDAYESASLWASEFNCNDSPVIIYLGDDTLYVFESCDEDKEIQYLRIENGEHNLHWGPGSQQLFQQIWDFLKRF